ncbi:MAG: efflux RND transporter periplasmic adaptor subunit [Nitrospirae bacterium]|nr:efflux RND transporter periplasmic adaptor subunit [Nitrospirota bacterium]
MENRTKIAVSILIAVMLAIAGGVYYYVGHRMAAKASDAAGHADHVEHAQYVCPMHPFIVRDKPGSCPICGMDLVKKVAGGATGESGESAALPPGTVTLSPTQLAIANVATVEARKMPLVKEINAVGTVAFDQSRQAKVTAWIAGRIDKLNVTKVGDTVSPDAPVAEIYSPETVSAQLEYLLALKSREKMKALGIVEAANDGLIESGRQRLLQWGVREDQLEQIEKTGKPIMSLPVYTPISGIVIEKMAQAGQFVEMGMELFAVADLTAVWVELSLYEDEFGLVKPGQRVEISSKAYPGRTFEGAVTYIYPFLDKESRTVRVRVEIPNGDLALKPEMYANAVIKIPLADSLAVPVSAVMDTGKRKVVWVEMEMEVGSFEPRHVTTGMRVGDYVQILSGLEAGEKVASSGGYMIDSESQLAGGTGHEGHGASSPKQAADKKAVPTQSHQGH